VDGGNDLSVNGDDRIPGNSFVVVTPQSSVNGPSPVSPRSQTGWGLLRSSCDCLRASGVK
jgi:hypothetical protein